MIDKGDFHKKVLPVTIGDRKYVFPVSEVECALFLHRSAINPVPFDLNGRVRGMFAYKGSAIAVVKREDMRAHADMAGKEDLIAVILRYEGKKFAILVDTTHAISDENAYLGSVSVSAAALYHGGTV